jgi:IS30 family transposase
MSASTTVVDMMSAVEAQMTEDRQWGDFNCTLTVTDRSTGWTETRAVRNKSQEQVFAALSSIRRDFPFLLLGIHSDKGSEFMNNHLIRYCHQEHTTKARSRPYRKNDNYFVEQKNWNIVRKTV